MMNVSAGIFVRCSSILNTRKLAAFNQLVLQKRHISGSAWRWANRASQENVEASSSWGSKKQHRKVKLNFLLDGSDPKTEAVLAPLRAAVKEQGDIVRQLKASQAPALDIKNAVNELKVRKRTLEDREYDLAPAAATFDRAKMDDVLKRRFFYDQSFAIYGGLSGQFDFGPMGCAIKTNILNMWRQFFVLEEQMLEVDCSILTPEPVLKASGHVDRFADYMVKDSISGDYFRLDHLIKDCLEKLCTAEETSTELKTECLLLIGKLDGFSKRELGEILNRFEMKSPTTGNELSEPMECNLMFGTQIGPTGLIKGYLRPETAQGIFVNFKRLLEFNHGKLPFAAAQIGNAFRNEVATRSGLIRVREFTMAEIEHFCDPREKNHPKFDGVKDEMMLLYSASNQMDGNSALTMSIGEAVETGLVANETLGYFMARIQQYMLKIGILPDQLRFRQHMDNEMAHYACDCWDAECLTSYGWVECVGCADRSAYDLTQHTNATGVKLTAERKLAVAKEITVKSLIPNITNIKKKHKQQTHVLFEKLANLQSEEIEELEKTLMSNGSWTLQSGNSEFTIDKDMVDIRSTKKSLHVEDVKPSVIEPSFGIGRIMYALLEHNFRTRIGNEYRYFSLPPVIAPLKCSVLPLTRNQEFEPFIREISAALTEHGVFHKVDESNGTIGRRYARADEIAIPYGITIDFDSLLEPHTVTVRERDTMDQVRIPIGEVASTVRDLSSGKLHWVDIEKKYPKHERAEKL